MTAQHSELPPLKEEWVSEEPWQDDSLADFETNVDHLEDQIRAQEKQNRLNFTVALGKIVIWAVYTASALLILGVVILAFHYMTPWDFLSESDLHKLQSIIFSGALGAMISTIAKQYIK
jgi:hypothetical protein